ncbi:MAG: DUF1015 family protein [Actinomycetota bacterium]
MPRLEPFAGLRFSPDAGSLEDLIAPPYDVVPPSLRSSLAKTPHNTVHLTLPEGETRYRDAAETLRAWISEGMLEATEPALYLYEQTSDVAGERVTVRGLLAAVAVDDVLPHERVYEKIVDDRFSLLQATDTELEPIVAIYDGSEGGTRTLLEDVAAGEPTVSVTSPFDGDEHRLWAIDDLAVIEKIRSDLHDATTVIADGHHRWTTATRHAAAMGRQGATQLMLLQDIGAHSPSLLSIHRVLTDVTLEQAREALAPWFDIDDVTRGGPEEWAEELRSELQPAFVFFGPDRTAFRAAISKSLSPLLPTDMPASVRRLDVAILHEAVFDELLGKKEPTFVHTPTEASEAIKDQGIAILLRPTPLKAVLEIAGEGSLMPRKSTFFLPKPVSGLLFRPLG